jgi:hypothetical protein
MKKRGGEYMNISCLVVNEQSSIRINASRVLYFDPFDLKDESSSWLFGDWI